MLGFSELLRPDLPKIGMKVNIREYCYMQVLALPAVQNFRLRADPYCWNGCPGETSAAMSSSRAVLSLNHLPCYLSNGSLQLYHQ